MPSIYHANHPQNQHLNNLCNNNVLRVDIKDKFQINIKKHRLMQPNLPKTKLTQKIRKIIAEDYDPSNQELCLSGIKDDWRGALEFRNWSTLRTLRIFQCYIEDIGAEFIGSLPWPNLQSLYIGNNNNITAVGAKKLFMKELSEQELRFDGNIVESMVKWQLKKLYLSQNNIGSNGAKLLIKAEFPLLEKLQVVLCQLGDEGAKQLAKGQWPNLCSLDISFNKIQFDGCIALTISNWRKLKLILFQWYSDETGVVAGLSLVTVNCPNSLEVTRGLQSNLQKKIQSILKSRFSRA